MTKGSGREFRGRVGLSKARRLQRAGAAWACGVAVRGQAGLLMSERVDVVALRLFSESTGNRQRLLAGGLPSCDEGRLQLRRSAGDSSHRAGSEAARNWDVRSSLVLGGGAWGSRLDRSEKSPP